MAVNDRAADTTIRNREGAETTRSLVKPERHRTWFDRLPHPEVAQRAADCLERLFGPEASRYLTRAGGDRHFALWLHLVDHQLAALPDVPGGGQPALAWRDCYERGWSPRAAAFAAWSSHPEPTSPPEAVEIGHTDRGLAIP
jgi:hypothetical protein